MFPFKAGYNQTPRSTQSVPIRKTFSPYPQQSGGRILMQNTQGPRIRPRFSSSGTYDVPKSQSTLQNFGIQAKKYPSQNKPPQIAALPSASQRQNINPVRQNISMLTNTQQPKQVMSISNASSKMPEIRKTSTTKVLVGSVEKAFLWSQLTANHHVLFDITGTVKSVRNGHRVGEKEIVLSDGKEGPNQLLVIFYETDRKLEPIGKGDIVRVVGRMRGRGRMQGFSVTMSSAAEESKLHHIKFICDRAAAELIHQSSL